MEVSQIKQTASVLFADERLIVAPLPTTARADLFRLTTGSGEEYVLKSFDEASLFWIELRALALLQSTGRVAAIEHSSLELPGFTTAAFDGPFVIAKPFYRRLLSWDEEPLVALERFAQLIDISSKFLRLGWRDLDGRPGNDAIKERGRIVRFDLDAALSAASVSSKREHLNIDRVSQAAHDSLTGSISKLLSEECEVQAVAIRGARFLLNREAAKWPLLDAILEGKRAGRLEEWLYEWPTALRRGSQIGKLTCSGDEALLFGRLLFEAISNQEYRLTLNDLYLCTIAITRRACRRILTDPLSTQARRLTATLGELEEIGVQRKSSEPTRVAVSPSHELRGEVDAGAWPAAKGTDWVSQDLARSSSKSPSRPMFVLADGASTAGGDAAIRIVGDWWDHASERLAYVQASDLRDTILQECSQLHGRLLRAGSEQRTGTCETTLVLVVVCADAATEPRVVIAWYGNSGYLIADDSDSSSRILSWTESRNPTGPLGSPLVSPRDLAAGVSEQALEGLGRYRIRAFSDGVFGATRQAYQLLFDDKRPISETVRAAQSWRSVHPQIGEDDWSVAGIDLESREKATSPLSSESAPPEASGGAMPMFPMVDILDLSDDARRLLADAKLDGRLVSVISDAFVSAGALSRSIERGPSFNEGKQAVSTTRYVIESSRGRLHLRAVGSPPQIVPVAFVAGDFTPGVLDDVRSREFTSLDEAKTYLSEHRLKKVGRGDRLKPYLRRPAILVALGIAVGALAMFALERVVPLGPAAAECPWVIRATARGQLTLFEELGREHRPMLTFPIASSISLPEVRFRTEAEGQAFAEAIRDRQQVDGGDRAPQQQATQGAATPRTREIEILAGDTLGKISSRLKIREQTLRELNQNITDWSKIQAGWKLRVPANALPPQ